MHRGCFIEYIHKSEKIDLFDFLLQCKQEKYWVIDLTIHKDNKLFIVIFYKPQNSEKGNFVDMLHEYQ